jgi:hypothetical protein
MTTARIALLLAAAGLAVAGLAVAGCGGGSGSADAAPDIDNGACGAMLRFTGEYVDWKNDTTFCGLPGSVFDIPGVGPKAITAPNGRVDLCIPDQATTLINITPPATRPSCKVVSDPQLKYSLPGIAVASKAVIAAAAGLWSGRTFIDGDEVYDPAKAQVFVHVVGTPRAISLDAAHGHGPIKAVATNTWALGDTGHEVFIPDVDPAGGSATLSFAGGATGEGSIPLVAGKMTTLTVVAH